MDTIIQVLEDLISSGRAKEMSLADLEEEYKKEDE